jgi:hypothetical protein
MCTLMNLNRCSGESALISSAGLPVLPREKAKFLIEVRFMFDSFYRVVLCCIKVDFEGYFKQNIMYLCRYIFSFSMWIISNLTSCMKWENQEMLLFQFYSYIDGSLHVSGLQAHPQENSYSCSHNHWFSGCTVRATCSVCTEHADRTVQPLNQWLWEQLCEFSWGWACRPETCRDPSIYEQNWNSDIRWFSHFICWKDARYKKLKISHILCLSL